MKTCSACGFENPDTVRFCGQCGKSLATASGEGHSAVGRGGRTLPDDAPLSAQPPRGDGTLLDADKPGRGSSGPGVGSSTGRPAQWAGQGGQYEVLEEVGRGGMAVVYRAHDRKLNRDVALKRLLPELARREKAVARLLREARAAAAVQHPHIVTVFDVDEDADGPYIAMEYVRGPGGKPLTLAARVKQEGVLAEGEAVALVVKLCGAAQQAHEQGTIHRDIKPANILLTASGDPKLADFGIAHAARETSGATLTGLTVEGATLGTLDYMAPEQEQDAAHVDGRADVYALGGVLYFCLTGHSARHFRESRVPASLRVAVTKSLEEEASRRWQTPMQFAQALARAIASPPSESARDDLAWRQAVEVGTPEAHQTYLRDWPKGRHAAEAQAALDQLLESEAWEKLRAAPGVSAIDEFLKHWARGPHVAAAQKLKDTLVEAEAWKSLREKPSLEACRGFLKRWPVGPHAKEAGRMLPELERVAKANQEDDEAWEAARKTASVFGFQTYFSQRPTGRHAVEAQRRIREINQRARSRLIWAFVTLGICLGAVLWLGPSFMAWQKRQRDQPATSGRPAPGLTPRSGGAAGGQDRGLAGRRRTTPARARATSQAGDLPDPSPDTQPPREANLGETFSLSLGEGVRLELCGIPRGEFLLGSTAEERYWAIGPAGQGKPADFKDEGEAPRRTRIASGFWMGRTEVTVGQWKRFVAETSHRTDAERRGNIQVAEWERQSWRRSSVRWWRDPGFEESQRDEHPVVYVSWDDATAFCRWLSGREASRVPSGLECRLPTESEWEYACRGGRAGTKYWWGDVPAEGRGRLNGASQEALGTWRREITWLISYPWSDGHLRVAPVDSFESRGRNGFGLADMLGNVWEWCLDSYDPNGARQDCWTEDKTQRVLRGGSYSEGPAATRCAERAGSPPESARANVGFRVVLGPRINP